MNKPMVSVIVPVFNASASVRKCLDSIIGQTYQPLEIIVIDDGSTDDSYAICCEYAKKDNRICVLTQKNSGPSATRNRGMDVAVGKYITYVDSDDYITPNRIEESVRIAEENQVDMVISNYYISNGTTDKLHKFEHPSGKYDEKMCREVALDLIDNNRANRIPHYLWIRLIKRELLENPRLRLNENVRRSEDYLFNVQLQFRVKSMYLLGEEGTYFYVDNPKSITRTYLPNYWHMVKIIVSELKANLPDNKTVRNKIECMLIQRSLIALHNAAAAEQIEVFHADCDEVFADSDLRKAALRVGLFNGTTRSRIYCLLLNLRLKGLLKKLFVKER